MPWLYVAAAVLLAAGLVVWVLWRLRRRPSVVMTMCGTPPPPVEKEQGQ